MDTFHYTDKSAWKAIRSQKAWPFKAFQPNDPERPLGAYFTDLPPTPGNLRTMYQRLRVPNNKKDYIFWFTGREGLTQIRNGRGRDKHIYYSPIDYDVAEKRQEYEGETSQVAHRFP